VPPVLAVTRSRTERARERKRREEEGD